MVCMLQKTKGKGTYYIEYISESSTTGEKYRTNADIYLSQSDFRDDGKAQYNHFYTTITDDSYSYDSNDYNY